MIPKSLQLVKLRLLRYPCISLQVTKLSNPPEKATARVVSFPIAYSTAVKVPLIGLPARQHLLLIITLFYKILIGPKTGMGNCVYLNEAPKIICLKIWI